MAAKGRRQLTDPNQITGQDILNCLKIGGDVPYIEVSGCRVKTPRKPPVAGPIKTYTLPDSEQMKYIDEYLNEEKKETMDRLSGITPSSQQTLSQMSEIEEESMRGSVLNSNEENPSTAAFKNYDFTCRYNPSLPTTKQKDEILEAISAQQVLIIEGATGSGKTTQVPQFILDDHQERREPCNIIVTQPRRIAAISIAMRVCAERRWELGGLVGYKIGMDKNKVSKDTCLTFVTTGVFLKQLVNKKNMDEYTHVILDEVHERDKDMDFVLLVVRKFLRSCSRNVKVILMSASFDVSQFGRYFSMPYHGRLEQPSCIKLEHTKYTITEYWLDDLAPLGELPEIDDKHPKIDDKAMNLTNLLIKHFDTLEHTERNVLIKNKPGFKRGGVLIFLPGIDEIRRLHAILERSKLSYQWLILTLHSSLTDQEVGSKGLKVFDLPPEGYRKIILSTNIAESSITVSDITYVIDFCLTKNLICDRHTNYTSLQMEWASKANCTQRKGRTGRIGKGRVYRMIPESFYHSYLPEYSTPEIKRSPLESIVLNTKVLKLGEPKAILAFALDPPLLGDIERSVLTLKEIGALETCTNRVINPFDGDMTFLGEVLAQLPVDVHIGKLLVLGFIFGFLEDCLIIGAGLSMSSLFYNSFTNRLESWNSKVEWACRSFSDCFAILNAYKAWKKRKSEMSFNSTGLKTERQWADYHSLILNKLKDMDELIEDLSRRLQHFHITTGRQKRDTNSAEDMLVLKIIIAGAFYPHYFARSDQEEREIAKSLSGKDPCSTIAMSGLPSDHGFLYKHDIEQMFKDYKIRTYFENTKCYVEFHRTPNQAIDGLILPAVYISVKRRLLCEKFTLTLLTQETVRRQLQAIEMLKDKQGVGGIKGRTSRISLMSKSDLDRPKLPSITNNLFYMKVIWQPNFEYKNTLSFYGQYDNDENETTLQRMIGCVNETDILNEPEIESPITPGLLCLAPCSSVKHKTFVKPYLRARVEEVLSNCIKVMFIDYGYVEDVAKKSLRVLDIDEFPFLDQPALAFEFVLAQVKPRAEHTHAGWSSAVISLIRQITDLAGPKKVCCNVYSVVQRIVHLDLIVIDENNAQNHIGELLKYEGLADEAEESYLSKQNHGLRENFDSYAADKVQDYDYEDDDCLYLGDLVGVETAHSKNKINLKGPHSPLEVKFYSFQKCGILRPVTIDSNSVNSVVLDAEPQDVCARMMVAATVGYNSSHEVMIIRNTTLLPNIHNLPALLSMLFAPKIEMRADPQYAIFTGILSGLGFDEKTKAPLHAEHDMEIAFDTEITEQDLKKINHLRVAIHGCLRQTDQEVVDRTTINSQNKNRDLLRTLICTKRKTVDRIYSPHSFTWGKIPEEKIMIQEMEDPDIQKLLIQGIRLIDPQLYTHLKALRDVESNELIFGKTKCRFCDVPLNSYHELKIHLKLRDHQNNVKDILGF